MILALALLSAARTYHFKCEYDTASTTGQILNKQVVDGDFTIKSDHEAIWTNATLTNAPANGQGGGITPFDYMNGFTYDPSDGAAEFKEGFFKGFPASAIQAKNLVWDTEMFLQFAKASTNLKLGMPSQFKSGDVALAGSGTFSNKNVRLTRIGSAKLEGVECDLIKYDAFFNSIDMKMEGGVSLVGRSHYWGEIYVRAKTSDIQSGTLYEDVLGELTIGKSPPQTINVFRQGAITQTR